MTMMEQAESNQGKVMQGNGLFPFLFFSQIQAILRGDLTTLFLPLQVPLLSCQFPFLSSFYRVLSRACRALSRVFRYDMQGKKKKKKEGRLRFEINKRFLER
jgi:hypothetical protein